MNPCQLSSEREFLIRLAPVWLACRWRIMGHRLDGKHWPKSDLAFDLLGMHDYAHEMRLWCASHPQTENARITRLLAECRAILRKKRTTSKVR